MLTSVEMNLLHALQWESHDFVVADYKKRWNLTEEETAAVKKWIQARIKEIKDKTANGDKFLPTYPVVITDEEGEIVAKANKTLYIRQKQ